MQGPTLHSWRSAGQERDPTTTFNKKHKEIFPANKTLTSQAGLVHELSGDIVGALSRLQWQKYGGITSAGLSGTQRTAHRTFYFPLLGGCTHSTGNNEEGAVLQFTGLLLQLHPKHILLSPSNSHPTHSVALMKASHGSDLQSF